MSRQTIRRILLAMLFILLAGASVSTFLWFKPHRNVQETEAYATISYQELIKAFETDAASANNRFLASDGNSKVLIISGPVYAIFENQAGETVVRMKQEAAKTGVSFTLLPSEANLANSYKKGDPIRLKGQIVSGNSYDADLDLHEDAVIVQAAILQ